jgi:ketosteroid isomerase-like protein
MSQQNVATAKSLTDALNRLDIDAWAELSSADFEWFPVLGGTVEGKSFTGREGIEEYFGELRDAWEEFRLVTDEFVTSATASWPSAPGRPGTRQRSTGRIADQRARRLPRRQDMAQPCLFRSCRGVAGGGPLFSVMLGLPGGDVRCEAEVGCACLSAPPAWVKGATRAATAAVGGRVNPIAGLRAPGRIPSVCFPPPSRKFERSWIPIV